jgi:collagenase-like PrtC family protease
MRFSVPTNWQEDLIPKIRKDSVEELYGKLHTDFVGGGRSSYLLPHISKKTAASHIQEAHKNGLKFNYLLNAMCLNNLEWTASGQRKLRFLLDWLAEIGVNCVTVSIPYLLELVKKRYPQLKVCVSTQPEVDGVRRAVYWQDLGADKITLSTIDVNRDFRLLKQIRKSVKCKLQLIANLWCLQGCYLHPYHCVLLDHSSQKCHPSSKWFKIDYCYLSCNHIRLKNPVEFIRSEWIRPEDVHYYEEIGIDELKFVDRLMTTDAISLIVNAYTDRYYNGNLLDLFYSPAKLIKYQKVGFLRKLRHIPRRLFTKSSKPFRLANLYYDARAGIYVDNQALNGFLERLLEEDCRLKSCEECKYCDEIAGKSVKIDPNYRKKILEEYRRFFNEVFSERISGHVYK